MMMGIAMSMALSMLTWLILHIEHDAWLDSQQQQASQLVERLAQSLKLPVLTHSKPEIDVAAHSFMQSVASVRGILVQSSEGVQSFGDVDHAPDFSTAGITTDLLQLGEHDSWFAKRLTYNNTSIGVLAVRFSSQAWEDLSNALLMRMIVLAGLVVLSALFLTYWVAGRMSKPLEHIAHAASRVGHGDYNAELPVQGNDELSDAAKQFNFMLQELRHKEEMRQEFGRYLNPNLVSKVFRDENASVENHRQDVTVLFADMVSFTAFSEGRDPEAIVDVLNRYFEVFHYVIDHFGGHVDKYIGDAVMAVFNHPHDDPHHARHAAMAGLAMAAACRRLGVLRDDGEPIAFRVGINAGEVIVGNIGAKKRLEYTVIGDAVNRASRMGGIGQGNEVALPESTFSQLGDGFHFEKMGDIKVKGVSEAMSCGTVRVMDAGCEQEIARAVALAFDLTLSADAREMIGEV
jgi:class 3 adenylate cyclase